MTNRQNQIVEKAIMLIAKNGIQSVTIKNLAHEVGVSEPALYRHFKNKSEILNAVIELFINKIQPAIQTLKENENPLIRIENFIKMHFSIFDHNNQLGRVVFSESNFRNEKKLLNKLFKLMKNSRSELEIVIRIGQNMNIIRSDISTVSISEIIIGALRFLVTQWSISDQKFNLKKEGNRLCHDVLQVIKLSNK
jgi:AcrR family transcriptional regulator